MAPVAAFCHDDGVSTAGAGRQHASHDPAESAERAESRAPSAAPAGFAGMLLQVQQSGGNAMAVRLMRAASAGSTAPADSTTPADDVADRISRRIGGGESLTPAVQERFGDVGGGDALAAVRVHRDAEAADLARSVG